MNTKIYATLANIDQHKLDVIDNEAKRFANTYRDSIVNVIDIEDLYRITVIEFEAKKVNDPTIKNVRAYARGAAKKKINKLVEKTKRRNKLLDNYLITETDIYYQEFDIDINDTLEKLYETDERYKTVIDDAKLKTPIYETADKLNCTTRTVDNLRRDIKDFLLNYWN